MLLAYRMLPPNHSMRYVANARRTTLTRSNHSPLTTRHVTLTATQADAELLSLNQRLLESIAAADWRTYEELCDPSLTAFEPEGRGQLIEGLPFHQYYFELGAATGPVKVTMASPRVRWLGADAAVISYVRLVQKLVDGKPLTATTEETRIWQRQSGCWRHVHFHRSLPQ